jgi:catechol 2,3-dioxygenase
MTTTSTNIIRPSPHHVTMKTSRFDEMIEWYGLVLGTEVQFRNEVAAWTSNDEANHRIAFLAMPGLGDDADKIRHNGIHHCAFEYASFADLMSSYGRLREAGVEPSFCIDHSVTISIYCEDPEGNYVELQSDNFSDWKLSTEYPSIFRKSDRRVFRSGARLRELQIRCRFQDSAEGCSRWPLFTRANSKRRITGVAHCRWPNRRTLSSGTRESETGP